MTPKMRIDPLTGKPTEWDRREKAEQVARAQKELRDEKKREAIGAKRARDADAKRAARAAAKEAKAAGKPADEPPADEVTTEGNDDGGE